MNFRDLSKIQEINITMNLGRNRKYYGSNKIPNTYRKNNSFIRKKSIQF